MDESKGILFDGAFVAELKEKFYMEEADPEYGKRLFFDNSGGSLRLKKAVEVKASLERYPDCPERDHPRGLDLHNIVKSGTQEMLDIVFRAKEGALMSELTASACMFKIVDMILDNVKGKNCVVSALEHPSSFDAIQYHCEKHNMEMRVAYPDPRTGRIEAEEITRLVDRDTALLSIMSASNVAGSVMDIGALCAAARAIKPGIYIISDAVQHAPHAVMDVEKYKLDAVNFAPYKFFSVRGCGFAYVSDRVAAMPHHKIIAKEQKVFELGTPAPGNFAAMKAVIDYVAWIGSRFMEGDDRKALYTEGMRRIHLQERALLYRMLEGTEEYPGLRHIPGVRIAADPDSVENRDLIAGVAVDGLTTAELGRAYLEHGIVTAPRTGDSIYSRRIVTALGFPEGIVRVSPLHCHSTGDIDYFLQITAEIAAKANH